MQGARHARLLPAAATLLALLTGCDGAPLREIDLDTFAYEPPAPTGLLESADARRLAYHVLGSEQVRAALARVGSQLPGLDRSFLFASAFDPACRRDEGSVRTLDFACLGLPSGTLTLRPRGAGPNANGDYDLQARDVRPATGPGFSGDLLLRVQGVANPEVPERFLLSLHTVTDGVSESFAAVERSVLVVENSTRAKEVWLYSEVEGGSFWVRRVALAGETLAWEVRDQRNTWDCHSRLEGARLPTNTCRTPLDASGFGVLEF